MASRIYEYAYYSWNVILFVIKNKKIKKIKKL